MTKPFANQAVRQFVRQTLGCTCPDDVFEHIASDSPAQPDESGYDSRLLVGNRLLIYLLAIEDSQTLASRLPKSLAAGKQERDVRGLNRFRAVLVAADQAAVTDSAQRIFEEFEGKDERVHLHIVTPAEVAALRRL